MSVPFTDFNTGTNLCEMLKKIAGTKKWLIGRRTPHREILAEGDKVLFYQGGEEGRKVVASAELASSLHSDNADSFAEIKNIEVWKKPVDMNALIDRLSFIKNKKHWGVYLQGGVVRIAEKDYNMIVKKRGKAETT